MTETLIERPGPSHVIAASPLENDATLSTCAHQFTSDSTSSSGATVELIIESGIASVTASNDGYAAS
ncbi:hypothetical protein HBI25_206580 [Parastagonospora nodorum]|nr:hypothetical protein HBI09_188220 [Parastagonospora nodorum]KAH4111575.1 hypothetical protein HBH47_245040 [Parastagonospora nodorum]KAH4183527.1 hypothetical protein HBH42_205790 [Parastagonospora nodorum]KAH4606407.1 hypothetical protein HBH82_110160 [Parastagonospora nodorum]KAH4665859.1 hypothetical protein HBH78_201720 [Parastagonospora nodorum]